MATKKLNIGLSDQKALQRELADHLRQKDVADLRLLRARIGSARVERQLMIRVAREQCKTTRGLLRERQASERTGLRAQHLVERIEDKSACDAGKALAKRQGGALELGAKQTLKQEALERRRVRDAGKAPKLRTTSRERTQEDDDAVRSNLPPELVTVFNALGLKPRYRELWKATPKHSRTEAFLDWAEENPDEILTVQQSKADQELKALIKQQRELGRAVRSTDRYKHSPAELRELLAGVPF